MTTTDPTPTQRLYTESEVAELRVELERVKRQVAAMREALEKVSGFGRGDLGHQQLCDYVTFEAEEALKPGAGRDYLTREQVKPLVEALREVVSHRQEDKDRNYVCWLGEGAFGRCEQALNHAKTLGL